MRNDSHEGCRSHCERKTRLEPEAAPRTALRHSRYPRLPDGRLPLGGFGVARPGRRHHNMKPEQATFRLPVCFQSGKRDSVVAPLNFFKINPLVWKGSLTTNNADTNKALFCVITN